MIQGVINRMAATSAIMKNYALGTFTMGAALARFLQAPEIMPVSAALIGALWLMDAKYLQEEKWFRDIFNDERIKPDTEPVTFAVTPSKEVMDKTKLSYGLNRWSTRWLYVPLIAVAIFLWLYFLCVFPLK